MIREVYHTSLLSMDELQICIKVIEIKYSMAYVLILAVDLNLQTNCFKKNIRIGLN